MMMQGVTEDWTWTEAVYNPEEGRWYIRLTGARHEELVGKLLPVAEECGAALAEIVATGEPFHIDSFLCEGGDEVTVLTVHIPPGPERREVHLPAIPPDLLDGIGATEEELDALVDCAPEMAEGLDRAPNVGRVNIERSIADAFGGALEGGEAGADPDGREEPGS
jgi:hypothetical protein